MQEAEERAQKALAILQSKDEELERLQHRLVILEEVAEKFHKPETTHASFFKLPLQKLLASKNITSEYLNKSLFIFLPYYLSSVLIKILEFNHSV